jgi:hypothetical protein
VRHANQCKKERNIDGLVQGKWVFRGNRYLHLHVPTFLLNCFEVSMSEVALKSKNIRWDICHFLGKKSEDVF